jgi:hypothetical protein
MEHQTTNVNLQMRARPNRCEDGACAGACTRGRGTDESKQLSWGKRTSRSFLAATDLPSLNGVYMISIALYSLRRLLVAVMATSNNEETLKYQGQTSCILYLQSGNYLSSL